MRANPPNPNARQIKEELGFLAILFLLAVTITRFTPLPGGLIIMGLFFILLKTGTVKTRHLSNITPFLLMHLSFFFIPPAVKVVEQTAALEGVVLKLIIILIISNMLVMGVTGRVVQLMLKKEAEHA